eukprot:2017119-Alexandrium_andersonii.AAC.1
MDPPRLAPIEKAIKAFLKSTSEPGLRPWVTLGVNATGLATRCLPCLLHATAFCKQAAGGT